VDELLLVGERAVRLTAPVDVAAAQQQHAAARETLLRARAELSRLRAALNAANRQAAQVRKDATAAKRSAAEMQIQIWLGESGDIESEVRRLADLAARQQLAIAGMAVLNFSRLPGATAAEMMAQAELKDRAADLVDAKRWARISEHGAALDELASSEGTVEIKAGRFDREGELADRFRSEAVALRAALAAYQEKWRQLAAVAEQENLL
jgi:sRNA-binding protein